MSAFMFATSDRQRALGFLQSMHPDRTLTDTAESVGPILDLVQADLIRVQDPSYHQPCQIVPGHAWDESRRHEVLALCVERLSGAPT